MVNIRITLDNIDQSVDANQLANTIENIVRSHTGMDAESIIYDNDNTQASNPILTQNMMKRIK